MIHFLVCARFRDTMDDYLAGWGLPLAERVNVIAYESMLGPRDWPGGTYIFSDLERLLPTELAAAGRLAERFADAPDHYTVLNDPRQFRPRYPLLRKLAEAGINDFNVHRLDAPLESVRFPVFLKRDYDHSGRRSDIQPDAAALRRALRRRGLGDRLRKRGLMLTEYLDVADTDGTFRKYSVMRVGDDYIPRHILMSGAWMTKTPDVITAALCEEEAAFVDARAVPEAVRSAFELAGLDYGRIDYGLKDGRVQVWEINANPVIVPRREQIASVRLAAQAKSAERINTALHGVDRPAGDSTVSTTPALLGLPGGKLGVAWLRFYGRNLRS